MAGIGESEEEVSESPRNGITSKHKITDSFRSCPRNIILKSQVADIAIHPNADIIAGAKITGKVTVCSFSSSDKNKKIFSLKHHKKACRSIIFSQDGQRLFTSSNDKTIQSVDMNTGQVLTCIKDAHTASVYKMVSISDKWIASGDEKGCVKIWDIENQKCFTEFTDNNTDYISDMVCDGDKRNLICTCGDGSLSVFNIRGKKLRARSDQMDTELLSLAIMKGGTKVVCGGGDGTLSIYSWGRWGDISDRFPGHQSSVDAICKVNEDILITGDFDGKIRSVHIQPNYFVSEIGKHGHLPIQTLQLSNNGEILASCAYNNVIKFWSIEKVYEHEQIPAKTKTKTKKIKMEIVSSDLRRFFADL